MIDVLLRNAAEDFFADALELCFGMRFAFDAEFQRAAFITVFEFSADPCQAIPAPHRAIIRFAETIAATGKAQYPGDGFWSVVRLANDLDPARAAT